MNKPNELGSETEEFNITEWDGTVDRVKIRQVWNEKEKVYDFLICYPDSTTHQLSAAQLETLKPRQIHY